MIFIHVKIFCIFNLPFEIHLSMEADEGRAWSYYNAIKVYDNLGIRGGQARVDHNETLMYSLQWWNSLRRFIAGKNIHSSDF